MTAPEQSKEIRLQLEADFQAAIQEVGSPFHFLKREHYWLEVERVYVLRASKWVQPIMTASKLPAA